jgi:nucleotide-binding universal stress UspA family protein
MLTIETILHPTDFSECSAPAFRLACSLARDHGARLVVLHVIPPPILVAGGDNVAAEIIDDFYAQQRGKLVEVRPPDRGIELKHQLVNGDPVEEILRAARDTNCGMIVMGTHGLSGLKRVLMGSVAEGVTRAALCPVVTVRAPFPQAVPSGADADERELVIKGYPS